MVINRSDAAAVQIVVHLKKENDSECRSISLTNAAKDIIKKLESRGFPSLSFNLFGDIKVSCFT